MAYCTLQSLTDRFGEARLIGLTDRGEEASGEIDETVVERAISDAEAAIDGFLKVRYALPLADVPAAVTDLALKIAYYNLHLDAVSEKVNADYQEAMKTLRAIAAGTFRLDVAGIEPAGSGSSGVRTNDRQRDMTPDNMKGFV
jgi:phage gp36-like protein